MNFEKLRAGNQERQIEWDPSRSTDLSYAGNELAGETGEACNIIKKLERERFGMKGSRTTVVELAEELADVVICVDLIADRFNIDLATSVKDKFNKTSKKYGLQTLID